MQSCHLVVWQPNRFFVAKPAGVHTIRKKKINKTKLLSNLLSWEFSPWFRFRRATLRKVAQVTPPPSPKNGEDVKGHSEWSTRLRNHSIPTVVKVPNGRRAKIVRIKKESPVFHHNGDLNLSRSSVKLILRKLIFINSKFIHKLFI